MNYDYTDSDGVAYFECDCGMTYDERSFNGETCPECV